MAESAAVETPNQVQIEDAGPARKRLKITVPAETVTEKLEESFATLGLQSAIPGFRKGRVPRALLERRFGTDVRNETRNQVIAAAYSKAIEDNGLKPVGEPELEDAAVVPTFESGKPLSFTLLVEVVPGFDLPAAEGVEIKRPIVEITEEHIDAEIKRNQFRLGTPERIEGPFEPYDRLLCRGEVTKDGQDGLFFETNDALVVVPGPEDEGRGQVLGLLIDGLEAKIKGAKVGDEIVLETIGPEFHEREDVRNAKLTMKMTVREAERITPLSVDELVERFGLGSPEVLREQVKTALEQRRDVEQRAALREQMQEYLANAVDFPLPEQLSAAQLTRMIERQRIELLYRGLEPEQVETHLARMRGSTEAQSRGRLKLFFILAAFADKFEIQVSEQEVNGFVSAMARQRGERPEKLRNELAQANRLGEVALQIRESKTTDRLLESAKISDIDAKAWNEEIAVRRGLARGKS
ncbi:MAG: trigger factor [Phycisphaerales bacterium]|nr:trigger factor [Phycisphaerales bacterium]